jgi:hypothetical protein
MRLGSKLLVQDHRSSPALHTQESLHKVDISRACNLIPVSMPMLLLAISIEGETFSALLSYRNFHSASLWRDMFRVTGFAMLSF